MTLVIVRVLNNKRAKLVATGMLHDNNDTENIEI